MDLGVRPMTFSTNPDGSTKWIFAQMSGFNGFAVVDFATRKEIKRIQNPDLPPGKATVPEGSDPSHGMAVTADGKTLVVCSRLNNYLYSYSLPDLKVLGGAELGGKGAGWVTLTPDGKTAYVANPVTNDVSVVDIKSMKEVDANPGRLRAEAQHDGDAAVTSVLRSRLLRIRGVLVVAFGVFAARGGSGTVASGDRLRRRAAHHRRRQRAHRELRIHRREQPVHAGRPPRRGAGAGRRHARRPDRQDRHADAGRSPRPHRISECRRRHHVEGTYTRDNLIDHLQILAYNGVGAVIGVGDLRRSLGPPRRTYRLG